VDEIITLLDLICDKIPEPVKSTCDQLVSTSIPIIITLIDQGIEAAQICTILKYCTGSSEKQYYHRPSVVGRRAISRPLLRETRIMPRDFCSICTDIVHVIEQAIDSGASIDTIEEMLDSFCEGLPEFQSLCESLVDKYTPLILELIDQGIEALEICQKIGICASRQHEGYFHRSMIRRSHHHRHHSSFAERKSNLWYRH
jgi:saposin